ncbi:unnamed protein product, partial [Rotaria socialis]
SSQPQQTPPSPSTLTVDAAISPTRQPQSPPSQQQQIPPPPLPLLPPLPPQQQQQSLDASNEAYRLLTQKMIHCTIPAVK